MTTVDNRRQKARTPESFHILVVDDDEDDREVVAELIRGEGYRVSEATSPRKALEALGRGPVDLVVAELLMRDLTGWELLKIIKGSYPRTRVVIITGHISREGEAILTDQKADGYLIKPVIPERMRVLYKALLVSQNLGREADDVAVDKDASTLELIERGLSDRGSSRRVSKT